MHIQGYHNPFPTAKGGVRKLWAWEKLSGFEKSRFGGEESKIKIPLPPKGVDQLHFVGGRGLRNIALIAMI